MATHINTGEWQSFEVRMRRRRVERLIVRAENALADGKADEVREALDEARRLAPGVPQIAALEQALDAAPADVSLDVPPGAPLDLPLEVAEASEDLEEAHDSAPVVPFLLVSSQAPRDRSRGLVAAAALLVIAASTGTGLWIYQTVGHDGRLFRFSQTLSSPTSSERPVATASLATPSSTPTASASTRVLVETVNASTVGPRPAPAPVQMAGLEDLTIQPPQQLSDSGRPTATPTSTSGAGVPAPQPREFEPGAATFAERTALLPPLDIPPSNMIADARTAVPMPALEIRPAPKAEAPKVEAIALTAKDDAAVRGVLNRYASAYSHLDAVAAQEVWPAVNRSALSRAFDGLASQHVSLERCAVDVHGATAQATCAGSATWSPKVGNGGTRTEARNWTFQLAKAGTDWQIVSARVQNTQNR